MQAGQTSKLSAALQLMRLPLAITVISNAQAALVLRQCARWDYEWSWPAALVLAIMSLGLYCFGAVSNDIIDFRRDQVLAPHRPLPSGRIGIQQAYLLAVTLLLMGLGGGMAYAIFFHGGLVSILFLAWTVLLIFFYNLTGKFVGAVGILTLGLTRFFHAAIPQPELHVIWHPLLIMDHVVILSALCYWLEGKRPRLSRAHRWGMALGLLGMNLLFPAGLIVAHIWRRGGFDRLGDAMGISRGLIYPAIAAAVFIAFAAAMLLSLRSADQSPRQQLDMRRQTGKRLMVFGLLWLVVYDMAFVYGYLREL